MKIHRDVGGLSLVNTADKKKSSKREVVFGGCGLWHVVASKRRREITCRRPGCAR